MEHKSLIERSQNKIDLLFYYLDLLSILNTIIDSNIDEECALELLKEVNASKLIFIIIRNVYKNKINSAQEKLTILSSITDIIETKIDIIKNNNIF